MSSSDKTISSKAKLTDTKLANTSTTSVLPTLNESDWQPISPAYAQVMRLWLLLWALFLIVGSLIFGLGTEGGVRMVWLAVLGALFVINTVLIVFWAPRRVKLTHFMLSEYDVHLQMDYMWYRNISVSLNRIQHVEVTQGPLERLFGLSKVVIYTAGGAQSDLKIPGLPNVQAHNIKSFLTGKVAEEEDNAVVN